MRKWPVLLLFIFSCGGDPEVPGETPQNPLKVEAAAFNNTEKRLEKTFLEVSGAPLTGFYSYTRRANRAPTESNAEKYYFPIVPINFNKKKDQLAIFAYCAPEKFRLLTNNLKKRWLNTNASKKHKIRGKRTLFYHEVPDAVIELFSNAQPKGYGFKISRQVTTIELIGIEGYPDI